MPSVCQLCQLEFFPLRTSKGMFCSPQCRTEASKRPHIRICAYCGETTTKKKPGKFCSHTCYLLNKTTRSLMDRLTPFINKTDYCWLWTGGLNENGYGRLFYDGQFLLAHRAMFQEATGEDITDKVVRHYECDNPPCVRPDHLKSGTRAENNEDARRKNRHAHGETSHARLTEQQVRQILKDARSNTEIAADYSVSRRNINAIKTGYSWKHIPR